MNNIIAVIPARAGSKGIPNKNIRIINGYPLVYYAIKNAIGSKYITEVIVSTDSYEVKTIASQMGVKVKWRDASLSSDDIGLDEVIYDAVSDLDYDYVVTMQATSPTLSISSLDNAISYAIEKHMDSVISVINKPHLSWRNENGEYIPNYEKRLNRQLLPPHYLETGAFLISKKEAITPHSRLGHKIGIFELTENESIDIDSFVDLHCAEMILKEKRYAIYVNGNKMRGMGHIYRALEIADELPVKPDIFYDINQTNIKWFGSTTHNLIGVDGMKGLFDMCDKNKYNVFINDVLDTTDDYINSLRDVMPNVKIINFEDEGSGAEIADLVINALIPKELTSSHVFAGENYYIPGKLFMLYKPIAILEKVKNIFVCFGGADPQNYTDRVLKIVSSEKYKNYNFHFAIGRAKNNYEKLLEYNSLDNIEIVYDVKDMPGMMTQSDVAITSRGRTAFELAILGIPSIVISQNDREETHNFISDKNGYKYIGINPTDKEIEDALDKYINLQYEERCELQKKLLSHNLRDGRNHVMSLIENL